MDIEEHLYMTNTKGLIDYSIKYVTFLESIFVLEAWELQMLPGRPPVVS